MNVELFEKIKNGEIVRTDEFQVTAIRRGTDDSSKYETYVAILDLVSAGYVEGEKSVEGCNGPNYKNLKVTKSGLKVRKFWRTPIDQIGKPALLEACRNGVVSMFAGRIVWWLFAGTVLFLIPTFSTDARSWLVDVLSWIIEKIE